MILFNILFFIFVIDAEEFAYPWQNIFEHPVSEYIMQIRGYKKSGRYNIGDIIVANRNLRCVRGISNYPKY